MYTNSDFMILSFFANMPLYLIMVLCMQFFLFLVTLSLGIVAIIKYSNKSISQMPVIGHFMFQSGLVSFFLGLTVSVVNTMFVMRIVAYTREPTLELIAPSIIESLVPLLVGSAAALLATVFMAILYARYGLRRN